MKGILKRLLSTAFAGLLVAGMVPAAAFAANEKPELVQPNVAQIESDENQSDDLDTSVAYESDELIIVYEKRDHSLFSLMEQAMLGVDLTEEGIEDSEPLLEESDVNGQVVLAQLEEGSDPLAVAEKVSQLDGVAYAQPNFRYKLLENDGLPNDPITAVSNPQEDANQYYLHGKIEADGAAALYQGANVITAWDTATSEESSNGMTIAILDTGVRLDHEDLQANILTDLAWDAYHDIKLEQTEDFSGDYNGHGTHVAGIAGAVANNGIGIAGSSYNAKILPIKVFNDASLNPSCSTATLVGAYDYLLYLITQNQVTNLHVINMSLGGYGSLTEADALLLEYIRTVRDLGVLTVCAGGNGDENYDPIQDPSYPCDWDECLSVTALNADGTDARWSDFNEYKDISAPGVGIYSTLNGSSDSYGKNSGTSMASPLVAGIAALCFAANEDASVDDVVEAIKETADPIDSSEDDYARWPEKTGSAGAINAEEAVNAVPNASLRSVDGVEELIMTQSMAMTVAVRDDSVAAPAAEAWTWSVENKTGSAIVSEDGILTGVAPGLVRVGAKTTIDGKSFQGYKNIEIKPLELSGAVEVKGGRSDSIEISWSEAPFASSYEIQRYEQPLTASGYETVSNNQGAFVALAEIPATDDCIYVDSKVSPRALYQYRVVPMGVVNDMRAAGASSEPVAAAVYENTIEFSSQESVIQSLLLKKAITGECPDTVVLTADSDNSAHLILAGAAARLEAPVLATEGSDISLDVMQALKGLEPRTVYVVGTTEAFSEKTIADIEMSAPKASVQLVQGDNAASLSENLYKTIADLQPKSAEALALVVGEGKDSLATSSAFFSYAYAKRASVYAVDDAKSLSLGVRKNLIAHDYKKVIIVGNEDEVPKGVEDQLNSLGISYERVNEGNCYKNNETLVGRVLSEGALKKDAYAFASAKDTIGNLVLGSVVAPYGLAVLLLDENAEDALSTDNAPESYTNKASNVFYGYPVNQNQSLEERVDQWLAGEAFEPVSYEGTTSPTGSGSSGTNPGQTTQPSGPGGSEEEKPSQSTTSPLRVYVKENGSTKLARQLAGSEIDSLAMRNTSVAGGYFYKNDGVYKVLAADKYVTLDQVLRSAGVSFAEGDAITIADVSGSVTHTFTKAMINENVNFYPQWFNHSSLTGDKSPTADAYRVQPIIALSWSRVEVPWGRVAGYAFDMAKSLPQKETTPRFAMGVSQEKYFAGEYEGHRFVNNVSSLTIIKGGAATVTPGAGTDEKDPNKPGDSETEIPDDENPLAPSITTDFIDVPAEHWVNAGGFLARAVQKQLITGYKDADGNLTGLFGPEDQLTRGQAVTILHRYALSNGLADNQPEGISLFFVDCASDAYYADAVEWASKNNIVNGYQTRSQLEFRPNQPMTREELAAVLYRFAAYAKADLSGAVASVYASAPDAQEVSSYAAQPIGWCFSHGIMSGSGVTNELRPQSSVTRAEATKMCLMATDLIG